MPVFHVAFENREQWGVDIDAPDAASAAERATLQHGIWNAARNWPPPHRYGLICTAQEITTVIIKEKT